MVLVRARFHSMYLPRAPLPVLFTPSPLQIPLPPVILPKSGPASPGRRSRTVLSRRAHEESGFQRRSLRLELPIDPCASPGGPGRSIVSLSWRTRTRSGRRAADANCDWDTIPIANSAAWEWPMAPSGVNSIAACPSRPSDPREARGGLASFSPARAASFRGP